jgi:hypothetical protein
MIDQFLKAQSHSALELNWYRGHCTPLYNQRRGLLLCAWLVILLYWDASAHRKLTSSEERPLSLTNSWCWELLPAAAPILPFSLAQLLIVQRQPSPHSSPSHTWQQGMCSLAFFVPRGRNILSHFHCPMASRPPDHHSPGCCVSHVHVRFNMGHKRKHDTFVILHFRGHWNWAHRRGHGMSVW